MTDVFIERPDDLKLEAEFKKFIRQENLFQKDSELLLAVSGGVDSMVLTKMCFRLGLRFMMAHANFQLRGEESERDEAFVKNQAAVYGVPIVVQKFETGKHAADKKLSVQVAARELRYDWFNRLLQEEYIVPGRPGNPLKDFIRPSLIVTAHHLNDNIETVLHNFFKGTGIRGMRGMLPRQGKLVRPLLFARKEELQEYANDQGLEFVEDSSNLEDKYSRNYLRHQLFPILQLIYPEVERNLAANISRFRDTEELVQQAIEVHRKKLLVIKGEETHIPVLKLLKSDPLNTVVYEIFRDYGFEGSRVNEVIRLLSSESGKYLLSKTHRILKNRNWLIVSKSGEKESGHILVEEHSKSVVFSAGELKFERIAGNHFGPSTQANIASLDADGIQFPLLLRKWKPGDYFYPLGMLKKKKLSRFFIDQKMSLLEKERTWVLEMNRKIIWVIGKRIDERFKLTPQSKTCLQISFWPASG